MRETKEVLQEVVTKVLVIVIGAIIAYKAHIWAFVIAEAERNGKSALGGELFVVPAVIMLTYWIYLKVEKHYNKKWAQKQNALQNVMQIHRELKEESSAKKGIIILDGNKITSFKNVNGEIKEEECTDFISAVRNM